LLDDIPGVGPATRKKLLKAFGSVRGISRASEPEIAAVVGPKLAKLMAAQFTTES
jgi:excinuclease ABC subunit C